MALPPGLVGMLNPKSSTGRADVLTRVVSERGATFDSVDASDSLQQLYIEITPLSFNVRVARGTTLTQLRVVTQGAGEEWLERAAVAAAHDAAGKEVPRSLAAPGAWRNGGIELRVDLSCPIVAYRARVTSQAQYNLAGGPGAMHKRADVFWEMIRREQLEVAGEMVLEKDTFYLLATAEAVPMPPGLCGVLAAYDVTSSEGRIHYAGFVDPNFCAQLTLEVRVYNSAFRIVDNQPIALLRYQAMSSVPATLYGDGESNYAGQRGPTLAKQFHDVPAVAG